MPRNELSNTAHELTLFIKGKDGLFKAILSFCIIFELCTPYFKWDKL